MCELFEAKVHSSPSGIEGSSPPITPLLTAERLPDLPFAHAFGRLPMTVSDASLGVLLKDLDAVSGGCCSAGGGCAYNLAVADGWVLMVPRTRREAAPVTLMEANGSAKVASVDVNGLGFLGSLLVRSETDASMSTTPLEVLRDVTCRV